MRYSAVSFPWWSRASPYGKCQIQSVRFHAINLEGQRSKGMKAPLARLAIRAGLVAALAAAMALFAPSARAQADQQKVKAQHEVDDAKKTTDEYGLAVPVPISHPGRRYPAFEGEYPTGPAVGAKLPDFKLPNQRGEIVDFHVSREGKKAVVVFYRSCVW
uniref:Uncharacterized protein n=1 Tax=uncultured bacterium FLS18 TaxID=654935 RepID=C6G413_9BACT|nr:hypothetical protein GP2143_14031 [uncultured bacterium FLS18]